MKKGFTLAEVLITLGIIGIVAALTMPLLIAKYEKRVTAIRIKKAYTEFSQAIKMSEVMNGPMKNWDYGLFNSIQNTRDFVTKYIKPFYPSLSECSEGLDFKCGAPVSGGGVNYILNNGVGLSMLCDSDRHNIPLIISTNTNKGDKAILGKDSFYFTVKNGSVMPSGWSDDIKREDILGSGYIGQVGTDLAGEPISYNFMCKKSPVEDETEGVENLYRHGCTALLFLDGWEFKDDYPW